MIVPLVATATRHNLNVEDEEVGLAAVEILHDERAEDARDRRRVRIAVTTYADDVVLELVARSDS